MLTAIAAELDVDLAQLVSPSHRVVASGDAVIVANMTDAPLKRLLQAAAELSEDNLDLLMVVADALVDVPTRSGTHRPRESLRP